LPGVAEQTGWDLQMRVIRSWSDRRVATRARTRGVEPGRVEARPANKSRRVGWQRRRRAAPTNAFLARVPPEPVLSSWRRFALANRCGSRQVGQQTIGNARAARKHGGAHERF